MNPELAGITRRRWMWATMRGALSAAISGAVIMATVLMAMS